MCTEPHPDARAAAECFLATNPADRGTYETTAGIEREVVGLLGELIVLQELLDYTTSGESEANVQALHIAFNRTSTTNSDETTTPYKVLC